MSFATPQQAVGWLAVTASGALVSADPTTLSALGDVGQISATLLSVGLVGSAILDRLRGGGDSSEDDTDDDDLDSLMGDDGLGDDGLDDMDDWGDDDPFGEMDGEDGDTDELEHRLDELEGEVGSLSSTVGTVRSENEEIANQVEEVSENVRKLLDIYEMVTRGINPFVDDVAAGGGGGGGGGLEGGSLGLFDDVDDEEDEEELDEDIANADAEGFFDEDLAEDDLDDEFDAADDGLDAEFDDGALGGELEDGFDDDEFDAADDETGVSEEMATEINDDEGKSFAELKAEYDSGDAEWAEEAANGDGADAAAAADEAELVEAFDDEADDDLDAEFDDGDLGGELEDGFDDGGLDDGDFDNEADDGLDPEFEEFDGIGELDDAGDGLAVADEPAESNEPELDESDDATSSERDGSARQAPSDTSHDGVDDDWSVSDSPDDSGFQFVEDADDDGGKPYLTALPSAYVADLVVMEWLEYLVDESTPTDAARAIRYYENVDWISEAVQEKLLDFLVGFGEIDEGTAVLPGTEELTRTHHTRSLSYINRLDGADAESLVVDRWNELGGPDGI